ncbi:DUF2497 domain-containing protein [Rhizobiales bacterium TNE-4]|nr:DUF2497 domain-containing protein [Rhizobiales bacterium TNE-4]MBV1827178.1 DUF2497 domain-containing protein [Rhizobiales bacterium TNE-4]
MTSASAKSSEPTIDDILASIRRIIADEQNDESSAASSSRTVVDAPAGEDVLDLAQPLVRPVSQVKPVAAQPSQQAVTEGLVAAIRPKPAEPTPVLPPKPQAAPSHGKASAPAAGAVANGAASEGAQLQRLIAGEAEEALSAAFGRISALKVTAETKTLEGLVADLLRPMLKEWLDANLPAIAERLVKQEIERISAQSGR